MLDSNEPAQPAQDDGRESHSDGPDHNQIENVYANDNDGLDSKSEGGESKKMNPYLF